MPQIIDLWRKKRNRAMWIYYCCIIEIWSHWFARIVVLFIRKQMELISNSMVMQLSESSTAIRQIQFWRSISVHFFLSRVWFTELLFFTCCHGVRAMAFKYAPFHNCLLLSALLCMNFHLHRMQWLQSVSFSLFISYSSQTSFRWPGSSLSPQLRGTRG
jgi:hypothetical protein